MKNIGTEELKQQAKELRKTALTMIYEAQSGHPGGAFSAADLVTALYFREMNLDPFQRPCMSHTICGSWDSRILS